MQVNFHYDPTTGTFTTRDPLDGVDGTPVVANPYAYADNDPLNRVDPLGLRTTDVDFDPCAGPLSAAGQAYCAKHGPPPAHLCMTNVDQCLGLGGSSNSKVLDATQYRDPVHFRKVLEKYVSSGDKVDVRWIESLGTGTSAVAWMPGDELLRGLGELEKAQTAAQKQSILEKLARFGVTAVEGMVVGIVCSYGFLLCVGGVMAGIGIGTAGLAGTDKLFGHEIGWFENITDAGLAATAGMICGRVWGAPCLKAAGVKLIPPPSVSLTPHAKKIAMIWAGKFVADQVIRGG